MVTGERSVEPDNEAKRCSMTQSLVQTNSQTNRRRLVLRLTVSINARRAPLIMSDSGRI